MGKNLFLSKADLKSFLDKLLIDYDVFVPVKKGDQRFYKKYAGTAEEAVIGEVRPFEPLKAFFSKAREKLAVDFKPEIPSGGPKPFAIVGVKACDLKGFKVQNNVYKENEYKDPLYIKAREENLIISADCTFAIPTCFCLAVDVKPYPQENFDLNLSQVRGGFIVTVGSDKGQCLVDANDALFQEPSQEALLEEVERRKKVIKEVEKNLVESNVPRQDRFQGIIEKNYESEIWDDEAKTCVECGACNTICPTCHCFLLADQKNEKHFIRYRLWDSCMVKDFARVAGGANPRPRLWMRLRNRFEKKFDFFPKIAGIYACTGCGRCITACPAKIDIRQVLKRLVDHV